MLELRPYQQRCCDNIWDMLGSGKNALLQAPTGAGKSCIVAEICNRLCSEVPGGRVVILVDREILVSQLVESIKKFFPDLSVGVVCASVSSKKDHSQQVTVASRQSYINIVDEVEPVHLVIADEAHLMKPPRPTSDPDQYQVIIQKLHDKNDKLRIFGCSATPYRLNNGFIYGYAHHPSDMPYFEDLTEKITYHELTKAGYLAPLKGEVLENEALTAELNDIALVAGEYNLGQLSTVAQKHVDTVGEAIDKFAADRKKIMVFAVDIDHCEKIAEAIDAIEYHSKLDKETRSEILGEYKSGNHRVIVSVATLTTGFDDPDVDCILMARPTMSSALFVQMIGRGLRPSDGKEDCLLIDLTENTNTHISTKDLDCVYVKADFATQEATEDAEGPYKVCPGVYEDNRQCLAKLHPRVCICPHCGYKFEAEIAKSLGNLESVEFGKKKLDPPEWIDVDSTDISIHQAKNGKKLIKVRHRLALMFHKHPFVYDWICTDNEYEGMAVAYGKEKWEKYAEEEMPEGPLALRLWEAKESFCKPSSVFCQQNERGYFELKDMKFTEDNFEQYQDQEASVDPDGDMDVPF